MEYKKNADCRLIYIVRSEAFPIVFITVYGKNRKENLTREQRNQLAKRADEIFAKVWEVGDGGPIRRQDGRAE
jgi:hypothetical protein